MEIKQTLNISFDDEYAEMSVGREMGMYALDVDGTEDFIIATEGQWLGGYSRTDRKVVFTILENTYLNGRTAYIHLTCKRNPERNITVAISQESMAYGFDFEVRGEGDETPELERISAHTQYLGVKNDDVSAYECESTLKPNPGSHRGTGEGVETLEIPLWVFGGHRRCYVSNISQYYTNSSGRDVRVVYDNGIKASVITSSEANGYHIFKVTNFGKAYLAKKVFYVIRLTHMDTNEVFCEVKVSYQDDDSSSLKFDITDMNTSFDGNGGELQLNVDNTLNYSDLWSTESDVDWIETVDSASGVRVSVGQFVVDSDDTTEREGMVKLIDSEGVEVDSITIKQTPIKSNSDNDDDGDDEEEPIVSEVVWLNETFAGLVPNPTNAQVMLQLSATWCIVSYRTGTPGITLTQDDDDAKYPFERKCRLLVKNANDLSKVLAFDITQNSSGLSAAVAR